MIISSAANEKIKEINKLLKSSKERKQRGLYVVEGIRMFREIPKQNIEAIYVAESEEQKYVPDIKRYDMDYVVLTDKLFKDLSDTGTPQGIMGVVRFDTITLENMLDGDETPCIFILEKLQDPGNLGTIIRTAEGAGATGIVISSDSVDLYNPKTVRSTMGSIFRVPIYISKDLGTDIKVIKSHGISVYGAHLDGKNLYDNTFTEPCAFLVGNEGNGLSARISETADKLLRIPMKGKVESLNAATSVAVIGYEVLRQRL